MRILLSLLGVVCLLPVPCVSAEETVIIHHSFGGSSDVALSASPVDSSKDSSGWAYAQESLRADGMFCGEKRHSRNAYLPFSPEPGHIYTCTLKLEISNPLDDGSKESKDWAAIGLSSNPGRNLLPLSSVCSLLLRRDGKGQVNLRGESENSNSDDKHSAKVVHGATTATLGLILNTTGNDWEVIYQVDGEDVGMRTFQTKPDIQFLGIGQIATAEGRFIELKLTRNDP